MTKPKPKDRKYRAVSLETRGGEVDRASFQAVNNGISLMAFHYRGETQDMYQLETMHGMVLVVSENPRSNFYNWALDRIKEHVSEKVPV